MKKRLDIENIRHAEKKSKEIKRNPLKTKYNFRNS